MSTFLILAAIAFVWYVVNKAFVTTPTWELRRSRAAWSWALVGAAIGCFFGIGFGAAGAIAGTIPGALVGYWVARSLMQSNQERAAAETPPPPRAVRQGLGGAVVGGVVGSSIGIVGGPLGGISGMIPGALLGYYFWRYATRDRAIARAAQTPAPAGAVVPPAPAVTYDPVYRPPTGTWIPQGNEMRPPGWRAAGAAKSTIGWWLIAVAAVLVVVVLISATPAPTPVPRPTNTTPPVNALAAPVGAPGPAAKSAPPSASIKSSRPRSIAQPPLSSTPTPQPSFSDARDCLNLRNGAEVARCAEGFR